HFVCADALSGIATCPADQQRSSEGAAQAISGTATDLAGNSASVSATVNIDTTPPLVALSSPTAGNTGTTVFTPSVTASGTVSDALSGVAGATCNGVPATINGG